LDVAALIAAMERFGVPDAVMDEVSTVVHNNAISTLSDVTDRLIAKGVSVANANRVKNALLPPASGASESIVTSSQSAASWLSSPAAVSWFARERLFDWVGISHDCFAGVGSLFDAVNRRTSCTCCTWSPSGSSCEELFSLDCLGWC
jgi:hypothetical protein